MYVYTCNNLKVNFFGNYVNILNYAHDGERMHNAHAESCMSSMYDIPFCISMFLFGKEN